MKKFGNFNIAALVIGFSFLYIPIILLILFSFNESRLVTVWGGFSTKWYGELMQNQGIKDAAWVTIKVAFVSSTMATILGTIAGLVMTRFGSFKGRTLFSGMIYAPMVMPEVIIGLSTLLMFVALAVDRGVFTVTLAHITFSMCYVAVVIQSRMSSYDDSITEAALDLGCTPFRTFILITLPIILPAVISGWLLSFTLSLDDLVIASFTSGPGLYNSAHENLFNGQTRSYSRNQCSFNNTGWDLLRLALSQHRLLVGDKNNKLSNSEQFQGTLLSPRLL
jgi:putrescine transport system permease protein